MLIGIDSSPCRLSLRSRSMFNYEMPSKWIGLKKCFCAKIFFLKIFYSFDPNHAYWNQRRLFSGNLPAMFWNISEPATQCKIRDVFLSLQQFLGTLCSSNNEAQEKKLRSSKWGLWKTHFIEKTFFNGIFSQALNEPFLYNCICVNLEAFVIAV